jgi:hypothetical protein
VTGRGSFRERWRREVWRTQRVSDSVRVVLLLLAEDMAANGQVSVPRSELAERLGRSPKRVTERLRVAIEAGLLARVMAGQPRTTAVYAAVLPAGSGGAPVRTPVRGADSRPYRGAPVRTPHLSTDARERPDLGGADGGPAIGKRESPQVVGLQRARVPGEERSSEEEQEHAHERANVDPWSATP